MRLVKVRPLSPSARFASGARHLRENAAVVSHLRLAPITVTDPHLSGDLEGQQSPGTATSSPQGISSAEHDVALDGADAIDALTPTEFPSATSIARVAPGGPFPAVMGVIRKKTAARGAEGGVKYVCDFCSADITSTVSDCNHLQVHRR